MHSADYRALVGSLALTARLLRRQMLAETLLEKKATETVGLGMSATIQLDIISDVVCPSCIIGYRRLQLAIDEMGLQDKVEIEWRPIELNPDMPAEGEGLPEHLSRQYGSTPEEGKRTADSITALGAELNFGFDFFEGMRIVNTRDAHLLLEFAKERGKQTELKLRLFDAYFHGHKDVSNRQILLEEIEPLRLSREEALLYLDDENARKAVESVEAEWRSMGVSSVPTMSLTARALSRVRSPWRSLNRS